jgi:Initiator Replication protein
LAVDVSLAIVGRALTPRRSGGGSVMDKNATVPKAIGLIQVKEQAGSLSLQDQKIINALLYYSYDKIIDVNAVHEVPLQDLREYLGSHESNDRVRVSLTNLSRIQLEFDYIDTDGDRKWGSGSLIVVSGHERDQDGLVQFTWPHWLRPLLAEPAKWARLSMPVLRAFQSKYGVRLYENLEAVANRRVSEWVVEVDDLRVLLGVGDKLKGWGSLYRRAVEPALAEVNQFADFSADWEISRQRGRKVVAVRFNVFKKGEREAREFNGRSWKKRSDGNITLKAETYEAARRVAHGFDIYAIEGDWKAWCQGKPKPRNPDGAFMKFVQQWAKNRQGKLLL